MNEYTICWEKCQERGVLTFAPSFVEQLLAAHPWAARELIVSVLKDVDCTLDCNQHFVMEQVLSQLPNSTYHQQLILRWLSAGSRLHDADLPSILYTLDFAAKRIFANDTN